MTSAPERPLQPQRYVPPQKRWDRGAPLAPGEAERAAQPHARLPADAGANGGWERSRTYADAKAPADTAAQGAWEPQQRSRTYPDAKAPAATAAQGARLPAATAAQGAWEPAAWEPVELVQADWSTRRRDTFQREFIKLPATEEEDAQERREAMGVRIEDLGSLSAAPAPAETFEELAALPSYALESLRECGIVKPMPIQSQAIPLVLAGCDVIGLAQTGSGKTLAFLLPAVTHIEAQKPLAFRAATPIALVLAPTRELAVQISEEATKVLTGSKAGKHRRGIWAVCIYGGGKRFEQVKALSWGSHIVVATPGRLIDFVANGTVSLERVTYFVLDEADRMLDMGFQGDVASLSSQVRPERQVLFFSATWSSDVQSLAAGLCQEGSRPVRIAVGQSGTGADGDAGAHLAVAREGIIQEVVVVDYPDDHVRQAEEKRRLLDEHLLSILNASEENKVLVFVSQKTLADELATTLWEAGFQANSMHGGKSQESRLWALDQFRKGELRLLVATDVLGRGIDIPSVSHVVIYEMGFCEEYVHRIGRTARGKDAKGHALVFFEYYYKAADIAGQLIEVLTASKQPVPQDLRRIAAEVASGKRQAYDPNQKWGGSSWKYNDNSWSGNSTWSSNGAKQREGTYEPPRRTTGQQDAAAPARRSNGRQTAERAEPAEPAKPAEPPAESWEDA